MGRKNGFSLVEAAVIMGLISLFFIPVANVSGGFGQNTDVGKTATDATRNRMRQVTAANTLMEEALVGDLQVPNVNLTTLDPNNPYSTGIQSYSNYNRQVNFDWTLLNQSFAVDGNGTLLRDINGKPIPLVNGNAIASATLRLYTDANSNAPSLVLPTTVTSKRLDANDNNLSRVGIMLVLDTSGSMAWARNDHSLPNTTEASAARPLVVSAPYLTYRYSGNNALDINNSAELDIVAALQNDNTATQYDETYIPGRSTAPNASSRLKMKPTCVRDAQNASYFLPEAMNPNAPRRPDWRGNALQPLFTYVDNLCKITPTMSASTWQNTVNSNLSRVEAARSALFVFLNRMESNPFLTQNTKLGFETYSTMGVPTAPLPRVSVHSDLKAAKKNKFEQIREWVARLNRLNQDGTTAIPIYGATPTKAAIQEAARRLYSDTSLTDRIIILMTDGVPTDDSTGSQISVMMNQLGSGLFAGANGKKVTVLSVGLIGADKGKLDAWALQNKAAGADGESFFASNVVETMSILDRVADKTISIALKANSCRYNVAVTNTPCAPN
jgi:hypothetical protein